MKRIMRRFALKEISGVDRPAQAGAKVAIMKRDEGSATPMSDRLADRIDDYKRIYPHLADEAHYSMAWRDLSLSDRAKVRDEESGAFQERRAEDSRYGESSMRAERRGEGKQTMKHEQVGMLLKALHGVYADEDLTKSERGEVIAEVLSDYRTCTGRDGLADISSLRTTPTSAPIVMKAQTRQDLAIELLKIKAAELRKARPELSESQAFAKVYTDPANAELAQIERAASLAQFAEQATQHGGGLEKNLALAKRDAAYAALQVKGEELRRADPLLTREGAIAKAMNLHPDLAARERQASRAALYTV